jgi:hypothetical protein
MRRQRPFNGVSILSTHGHLLRTMTCERERITEQFRMKSKRAIFRGFRFLLLVKNVPR